MGAFKIQTDLDLSGFNLLNFCIQSYTDLENVPNLGLGRKLFFTGNSTDEKNLREVIWNGVEWKAAAYLDDIEAITNGEGSLGTRVKALEDMLGLEDVTDVIDTWNDVKEFFKDVEEGLDLMTMLDGKLDKTGGTIDGRLVVNAVVSGDATPLRVRTTESSSTMMFRTTDSYIYFGYRAGTGLFVTNEGGWSTMYPLIHTGNFNDIARPLASGTWGIDISGTADKAKVLYEPMVFQNLTDGMTRVQNRGVIFTHTIPSTADGIFPTESYDNSMLTINRHGDSGSSSQLGFAATGKLYYRLLSITSGSAVPTDWKTIAFTDSDITGNAATATKLKTAVSLWGNTFDGTQSLDGNIRIANSNTIFFKALDDKWFSAMTLNSNGLFALGYDTTVFHGYRTHIYGGKISFLTGEASATPTTAMTITEEGFVGIGNGTPIAPLTVAPKINGTMELGTTNGIVFAIQDQYKAYGINFNVRSTGIGEIQVGRTQNGAKSFALNLNPLGGAINLGTNVHVGSDGQLYVGTKISTDAAFTVSGGRTELAATGVTPSLEALPSSGLVVGSLANALLMYLDSSNGLYNIQAQATNSKVAKGLYINPLGGNVNIASADASTIVKGGLNVAGDITLGEGSIYGPSGLNAISLSKTNLSIGYGYRTLQTDIYGGRVLFKIGETPFNAMLINASGNVTIGTGDYAAETYAFYVHKALPSYFSNRVLINGVPDDGTSALQWAGTAKTTNNTYGNIEIRTARGLSWHAPASISSWTRGLYAYDNSNPTPLGIFGFKGAEQVLEHAFIGNSATSPWFTINSTESNFNVLTNFNAGALIPTGQKMTFGADGPTMEYDADANAIKVTGNIYATGTLASGGKAAEGEGDTSGGGNANVYSDVLEGVITQEWEVGNPFQKEDVIVSLYMWNTDESRWEMVLADIGVTSENIWVTFGRPTSTTDKYMAVVMG